MSTYGSGEEPHDGRGGDEHPVKAGAGLVALAGDEDPYRERAEDGEGAEDERLNEERDELRAARSVSPSSVGAHRRIVAVCGREWRGAHLGARERELGQHRGARTTPGPGASGRKKRRGRR